MAGQPAPSVIHANTAPPPCRLGGPGARGGFSGRRILSGTSRSQTFLPRVKNVAYLTRGQGSKCPKEHLQLTTSRGSSLLRGKILQACGGPGSGPQRGPQHRTLVLARLFLPGPCPSLLGMKRSMYKPLTPAPRSGLGRDGEIQANIVPVNLLQAGRFQRPYSRLGDLSWQAAPLTSSGLLGFPAARSGLTSGDIRSVLLQYKAHPDGRRSAPIGGCLVSDPPPGAACAGAVGRSGGTSAAGVGGASEERQAYAGPRVHNAEPWLDECLRSVLQQDFEGTMELSVFNDASKDKSGAIIEKWRVKLEDSGVHVIIGGHDSPSPRGDL
ncbi:hypothetical protein H8959_019206 [Pygathrix nigripes]